MGVTIKDVAKKANVSITTVSRVLNDKPDVNGDTKEKIKKIIDELNYKPNDIARGLVLNKTNTIGLIIPDIANPFFPGVARGVEDIAREFNYSVIYSNTGNDEDKEKEAIELLKSKRVDGMIVSLSVNQKNKNLLNKLEEEDFPVVQIDRKIPNINTPAVVVDNIRSSVKVINYLKNFGHTKIGHITGNLDVVPSRDRLKGFKQALNESGLKIKNEWIKEGDYSKDSGYQCMKKILVLEERPTAVFVANDLMALGAYQAIQEKGYKVPEDISIIGHDDIELASLVSPKLTTINQPKYKLGENAVRLLIKKINNSNVIYDDIVLSTKLVIRDSVMGI